jgi:anaerobic ribonucleoside-triphosphate reductase activating protein
MIQNFRANSPAPNIQLNVADLETHSVSNGPGVRFVIWVQGCPFRCHGCSNGDFLEFRDAQLMSVTSLTSRILDTPGIEGVTLSGGEPMSQAEALVKLVSPLKSAGLSVVCFSGYTVEELQMSGNPWQTRLLKLIDVLIDGRYVSSQPGAGLTGSRNQKVHYRTNRYSEAAEKLQEGKVLEVKSGQNEMVVTGVFESEIFRCVQRVLESGPRKLIQLDSEE